LRAIGKGRFTTTRGLSQHFVERDGSHLMTVNTAEAAEKLAAILNSVDELSLDVTGMASDGRPETARVRIAHAVARACCVSLDFDSLPRRGQALLEERK
jgi:hypothetical protein